MNVKTWIPVILLFSISLLALGCSQTPVPASYPYGFQHKMQAAKHWQILAQDVSSDIAEMVQMLDEEYPGEMHDQRVQIMTRDASSFSRALESFMVTDLTHSGIRVTNDPDNDYQVYWSVQSVNHKDSRTYTKAPPGTYVIVGALGYGVYRIFTDSTRFAQAVTAGAAIEVGRGLLHLYRTKLPDNEIIVNVTIKSGNSILYRMSNIYYINDLDTDHYHFSNDLYFADKNVQTRTVNVRSMEEPSPVPFKDSFEMIFFEFDEYEIQDEHIEVLERYAGILKEHPETPVVIEGHTDSLGSEEYNLALSQMRAGSVYDYFVRQGISSERLQTKGHAFYRPIAPNVTQEGEDNPEGRARNRRAELHMVFNQPGFW